MVGSMPQRNTVAGIFENAEAASRALGRLGEEHFDLENEVSVIVSRDDEQERVPIRSDLHFWRTAPIGAAIGAVLAGTGVALAGLTSGPFTMIAAGPVFAALEAACAGAAAGFALGALMSLEHLEPEPDFSAVSIRGGAVWVRVEAAGARAERARQILAEAGARPFAGPGPEPVPA